MDILTICQSKGTNWMSLEEAITFFRIRDETGLPAVWLCWGLGEGACIMCHWQAQLKAGTCECSSVLQVGVTAVGRVLGTSFLW